TVDTPEPTHAAPQLAVLSCPAAHIDDDYDWLRATPTDDPRAFTVDVRFPEPGRYAMSVFDRSGQFNDAGLQDVVTAAVAADESASTSASASRFPGPPGFVWIGAAAVAAVAAAVTVAARRRRSS
ncbi:MAG: hypothetical protein M3377_09900, partial [Actinomycetota bacterium]|nr:hypothetical protein [Actinomycetota bacterium]